MSAVGDRVVFYCVLTQMGARAADNSTQLVEIGVKRQLFLTELRRILALNAEHYLISMADISLA
jgi:hypothetical protein